MRDLGLLLRAFICRDTAALLDGIHYDPRKTVLVLSQRQIFEHFEIFRLALNFFRFCQQSIVFDVLNQTLLISVDNAKAIV